MLEISKACKVLFGPEVEVSVDFLTYLQPEGLKSAYRKRALETHPDRSNTTQKEKCHLNELFVEVNSAYRKLQPLVTGNAFYELEKQQKKAPSNGRHREEKDRNFSYSFNANNIPKRRLKIGQFLYYSGLISWQTLIDAIVWQRRHRPRIGEIAVQWNMLSEMDVQRILEQKGLNEKFGERALFLGYLNRYELMALLGKQRNLNFPIGEYFVRHGILRTKDIEYMVQQHLVHNKKMGMK